MASITPQRTVDIALSMLRKDILTGKYPPLSLLPSERKLSEELSINRQTLRSALARLESEGLIKPYHGRGIQVLDYTETGTIDLLAYTASASDVDDFFLLRKNIAAEAAAQACIHATIHELNLLRSIATEQHQNIDIHDFFLGDIRFTKTLVKASKSLVLQLLFNSFERILIGQKEQAMKSLSNREAAIQSYIALIALIRNRDPLLCRKAIIVPSSLSPEEQAQIHSVLALEYNNTTTPSE